MCQDRPNIARVIKYRRLRWSGHVARLEEGRSVINILTGKPTGKSPLRRPRRRWEDNIRMDLEEISINAGNWVDSAQDRDYWRAFVNAALNLWVQWSCLVIYYLLLTRPCQEINLNSSTLLNDGLNVNETVINQLSDPKLDSNLSEEESMLDLPLFMLVKHHIKYAYSNRIKFRIYFTINIRWRYEQETPYKRRVCCLIPLPRSIFT